MPDSIRHPEGHWIPVPVPDPIRDSPEFEESAERSEANDTVKTIVRLLIIAVNRCAAMA